MSGDKVPLMLKFLFLPIRNESRFLCIKYQLISYKKSEPYKKKYCYGIPTVYEIQQKLEDSMLTLEV